MLVALAGGSTVADDVALGRDMGLQHLGAFNSQLLVLRVVLYRIPDARPTAEVLSALAADARVLSAQPNYVSRASAAPGKRLPQYAPDMIRLSSAHEIARGRNVRIAIIDTGVDTTHPEIAQAVAETFDAVGVGRAGAEAHGTAIVGIVAARAQLKGIAPEATVIAINAFRSGGAGPAQATTFTLLKGMDWAHMRRARVINMSFAGPQDPLLGQAIDSAARKGAILVSAAGNGGPEAKPAYPAALANVIAVSAVDSSDRLYKDANRGTYIAVAAPGVDILAPAPSSAYELSSGTSLAAAHVSGIVALMLERKPDLTPGKVREILKGSARQSDKNLKASEIGAGIVDAGGAVGAVR